MEDMREIKFRAWKTNENMMYYGGFAISAEGAIYGQDWSHPTDKLMQYTGLKDKNGKEIYEGDIVGYYVYLGEHLDESGQSTGEYACDGATMVIEWDGEKAQFKTPYSETGSLPMQLDLKSIAIIGNIYENPELITPQPDTDASSEPSASSEAD